MSEDKMSKPLIILLTLIFLSSFIYPVHASYSQMPEFLCELGLKFYQQGRYVDALHEFQKALIVQSDYKPALKYIEMINQIKTVGGVKEEIIPFEFKPISLTPAGAVKETLDLIELQREMLMERQLIKPGVVRPVPEAALEVEAVSAGKKPAAPRILTLDETLSKIALPIEIEQGKSIVMVGENIKRFLVTQPDVLTVERKSPDEILIKGKDIGYTYVHVWDDTGRWTTEFLGVFPKPEGPTYEERMRKEEEGARHFKLHYYMDWSSYESGRRINSLGRSTYSWSHNFNLTGETPYGNLDSSASLRRLKTTSDLTYLAVALTDGRLGPFKGFTLRGADYQPSFSNLEFPGATLRGVMLSSPAFNNKLDYTTFWGREGGGRYGSLSPGLAKSRNSFLEGVNLNYSPLTTQNYKFTAVHGHGRDRDSNLNRYGYDLVSAWNFHKWGVNYEIANDSETFAHLLNARYARPKLSLNTELRNISKNFNSITGKGWRSGELGALLNVNYAPFEKLAMSSRLDVFQDRLYPAQDNDNRLNEDFNWDASFHIDPTASLNLNYILQNALGRLSQYRYQSPGIGLSKEFKFMKDIYTYANYYHQESKNFSSPTSDYINDRIYLGLRFSLIGELYYYLNRELNWLRERFTGARTEPNATETGVDWSSQVGKTPFYGTFRFTFRNEEDTVSNLSFLSGEDYIEGYSELSFRPSPDKEIYGSCRARNVWADNPRVSKRVEMSFNAGMRYLWDTGLSWESVGNIEGYIFKDYNSDGLRQRDEPPVQGVKMWLGKDKFQVTDMFGYYKFKGIRARRAYVSLDSSSLPPGFVLTVPLIQEVIIENNRTLRLDFGIISQTQISGLVFEDTDGNSQFNKEDKGIANVAIVLEDGKKAITDAGGKYSFMNISPGEHTLTLDLNSLPVNYLPRVPLAKKITLFEGVTYFHSIPLKRIEE